MKHIALAGMFLVAFVMSANAQTGTDWRSANVTQLAAAVETACSGGGSDACAAAAAQLQQTMSLHQQFTRQIPRYTFVRVPVRRAFGRTSFRTERRFAGYTPITVTRTVPRAELAAVTRALSVAAAAAATDPNPTRANAVATTLAGSIEALPPAARQDAATAVVSTLGQTPGTGTQLAGQVASALGIAAPELLTTPPPTAPVSASPS